MTARTSQTHPLRVDFLNSSEFPILNNLGMTFAPGKKQPTALTGSWERDLESDIARLRDEYRADVLASVMELRELEELGIAELGDSCGLRGIEWLTYSVVDGSIPTLMDDFAKFVEKICKRLEGGKRVVIHCKGGLGRTGLTAACVIVEISGSTVTADEAIKMVRAARPQTIETSGQEQFVQAFWKASNREVSVLDLSPDYRSNSDRLTTEEEVLLSKFKGCLLGGAIGDALGAPIEFDSTQRIHERFGPNGLADYAPAYGRIGAITDDTQMTLFTAEGLIRANSRFSEKGICNPVRVVYYAYLRWLQTQGTKLRDSEFESFVYRQESWLRDLPELNSSRAPGNTCLAALRSGRMGTIGERINNSKGCGGVMRVAPVGLFATESFRLASEVAAITHGHPAGYLSAGVLAEVIKGIIQGNTPTESINHAVYEILPRHENHEETFHALDKAIKLAADGSITPSPETLESLGGGWIGEEALAIAIYCSLVHEDDFQKAVLLAVNHSGDSDSTGSITGNILGTFHGDSSIPSHWLERLELRGVIEQVATDLLRSLAGFNLWEKYPGC